MFYLTVTDVWRNFLRKRQFWSYC